MLKLSYVYFSATSTTQRCVETVGEAMGISSAFVINIADNPDVEFPVFGEDDVVIVGSPVYGGRIHELVGRSIARMSSHGAKAIAMVVYGNRDYDDALLELTDTLTSCGFNILGAGAFIGQHSIFPKVGSGRPDASDLNVLTDFGKQCRLRLEKAVTFGDITVKGNRPYKKSAGVPLHPSCEKSKCSECGQCATLCPVAAIDRSAPYLTDNEKCISCGRCIHVCTKKARRYAGLKYSLVGKIFVAGFSKRKEPEWKIAD